MAAPFTITSVSNYNSNPPSDDGAQTASNRVQWSTQKSKLSDPIKTAFDASETATSAAFGKVKGGASITTTAVDYTITASDQGKTVKCTASGKTITTPDATAVGSPFVCSVVNLSSGNITLDGNGAQTVDGVASFIIPAGCGVEINTDGANWFTDGKNFYQSGSGISINTATSPVTISAVIPNYISGLILATAGPSSTFTIGSGAATDSTNVDFMILGSSITKTTSSWAVGSTAGALDTGAIASSTWYHVYLIKRTDTGVVDILISLSASSPTLPTNYTLFRVIGSMLTDGSSHWTLFTQIGARYLWNAMTVDLNTSTLSTTAVLAALSTPPGVNAIALIRVNMGNAGGACAILLSSPLESDQAPSTSSKSSLEIASGGTRASGEFQIVTDTSRQVRVRGTGSSTLVEIDTYGWIDTRRNN